MINGFAYVSTEKNYQVLTYIKEYNIAIWVSIMTINAIESLRKLHITDLLSWSGIHHKAHGFTKSLTVVYIVITINIQYVWSIWDDCWYPDLHSSAKTLVINRRNYKYRWNLLWVWERDTREFMAPAFLWWSKPGLFSRDTYTKRGNSFPSISRTPFWPRKTCRRWQPYEILSTVVTCRRPTQRHMKYGLELMDALLIDLNHARMIPDIVARPWSSILHCPSLLRNLQCCGNQPIYPNFELLIVSLHNYNKIISKSSSSWTNQKIHIIS